MGCAGFVLGSCIRTAFFLNVARVVWSQVTNTSTCEAGNVQSAPLRQAKVAVVGAGAAGLVAAKELRAEGHIVGVFEQIYCLSFDLVADQYTLRVLTQAGQPGGTWVYDAAVEDEDLLGVSETRTQVHSSMYENLRTNIPREIMGYQAFWFGDPLEVRPVLEP
eukprot:897173-Pyramimonas_sp.AAC.1